MKVINAEPKKIRQIFSDNYVIPDFQRPYIWEKEQCETLWEDVVDFHNLNPADDEEYFLGNIVVHKTIDGKFSVIDGQQRLTTLLLLIRALHSRAATYSTLQSLYQISNKRDGSLTKELRVESKVIAEDAENLRKVIFGDIKSANECSLAVNYHLFVEKIEEWQNYKGNDSGTFETLIDTFLDKVALLPINCDSEDDALTIFQTINNRGISLSDPDIFKAKLYKSVPLELRPRFIEDWNNLYNHEWLFRLYMHIVRANKNDTSKEIGLRIFFNNNLGNWSSVMESLKKINAVTEEWNKKQLSAIDSLWSILETYPNQYWKYPVYVFLHKYGVYDEASGFTLPDNRAKETETLLEKLVKYYFVKGLVYNSVNNVKISTFKACAQIANEGDYLGELENDVSSTDKERVISKLENGELFRYTRGIVALASYLNPEQDKDSFAKVLSGKYHIEHILPKSWNHYDGWTSETHKEYIDSIGNLIPLEYKLNIKAQNEYFRKKKEYYESSRVQDALDLLDIADSDWIPMTIKNMSNAKITRLAKFFGLS